MAIQKGTVLVRGKLGNIVGMKNGFGTKKEAFARQYVAEVTNPQTDSQMNQRTKMLPAVLFRRQLSEVISRAWEGKKYGGQSIREFMKYALKEPWTNVPQLAKDSSIAIPGAYMISKGSLATIGVTVDNDGTAEIRLTVTDYQDPSMTIGALTDDLLSNNNFLREGDQITFIQCLTPNTGIPYVSYVIASFFLDTNNTEKVEDVLPASMQPTNILNYLSIDGLQPDNSIVLGFAAVLSRDGASAAQRSTQRMVLNTTALSAYFASALKPSVEETYKDSTTSRGSTDWPYDENAEGSVATEDGLYTLSGLTGAAATKNGTQVKVKYIAGTEVLYAVYAFRDPETPLVGTQPFCVGTNGTPVIYTDGGDETGLSISAVPALANLRQIAVS